MKKKLTAVFLAALMLCATSLSGCADIYRRLVTAMESTAVEYGASVTAEPSAMETLPPNPEKEYHIVPFSEMEYTRPDADGTVSRLDEIAELIENGVDVQELKELTNEADALFDHFETMDTLSSIHSDMYLSDEFWREEQGYTSTHFADVSMAYDNYCSTLYASPYKEQIEEEWDADYFEYLGDTIWYTEESIPLYAKEAQLISDYTEMLSTSTILYDGQELSLTDIEAFPDYDAYLEAVNLWYGIYNPKLGELYVELVKTRQQLAEVLGFDSYIDMQFEWNDLDYTPEMAQSFLDDVAEYLTPVYRRLTGNGAKYLPEINIGFADYSGFLNETLAGMDPALAENFQAMLDNGLCDYEIRPSKYPYAYTVYLFDYSTPFVFLTFSDDEWSISTLNHEFGHFNSYLSIRDELAETTDTAEIFSQALDLLVSNHYTGYFGEDDGYELRYDTLSSIFQAMVEQPFFVAMEFEIYSLSPEEITVDRINEIATEQSERFGLLDAEGFNPFADGWVSIPHIYNHPLYTISYGTSADIALQLWELSLTDEPAAIALYNKLLAREESAEFLGNIASAGLNSPFDSAEIQRVAGIAQTYLIDEDWEPRQEAA